jgi:uncharacterized protein YuzE
VSEIKKTKVVTFQTRAEVSLEADVAYIYIQPQRSGEVGVVATSRSVGNLLLDFDSDGRLFGIEFLSAEKELPQFVIDAEPTNA